MQFINYDITHNFNTFNLKNKKKRKKSPKNLDFNTPRSFSGNHENARLFLQEYEYIPNRFSESQLNRRLHAFDGTALNYLQDRMRKRIATVPFSQITGIFPRSIKALTSRGFEIKVFNFNLSEKSSSFQHPQNLAPPFYALKEVLHTIWVSTRVKNQLGKGGFFCH